MNFRNPGCRPFSLRRSPGLWRRKLPWIEAKLPKGGALIAMCIEGEELSSPQLAEKMRQFALSGVSNLTFLIGGSVGTVPRHQGTGGFSPVHVPMTFPITWPGDASGTDLPGLSDQRRHKISQVTIFEQGGVYNGQADP